MTTITYKNIHNYKFNEIKKIVESELGFNNDFIEKNTNKEIIYRFKHEGEYLNIYIMQLYLYKDCKSRIKFHLNCEDKSVTKLIWFLLPFFPLFMLLMVIAYFGKYDSDNLVKAKLDKHFL